MPQIRCVYKVPVCQQTRHSSYRLVLPSTYSPAPTLANSSSITYFVQSIEAAQILWTQGSELEKILDKFSGDVVQAMQALKETAPAADAVLEKLLQTLLAAFASCEKYCASKNLENPFKRASRQVRDSTAYFFPDSTVAATHAVLQELVVANSTVEMFPLGARSVPRLFNGLWQLASSEWGYSSADKQQVALTELAQAGFTAADMADHYVSLVVICRPEHY